MSPSTKPRIALLTSAALPELYLEESALIPAFQAIGVDAQPVIWSDASVDWRRFDRVVIRSPWDYFERIGELRGWLAARAQDGTRMINPQALLEWNLDKFYLRELSGKGVGTLPTVYVPRGERCDLRAVASERGWRELVVKPSIAGGAFRTLRFSASDCAEAQRSLDETLQTCGALIQAFAPEIAQQGEWSLFYFAGVFSHAILKSPAAGDFRVQPQFGGTVRRLDPPASLKADAEAVLAALPVAPVYARIDGIDRGGRLLLMEAELFEPYLFLAQAPEARDRYVRAIVGALGEP